MTYTGPDRRHGLRRTYQRDKCRCRACRRAEADYRRKLRTELCRGKLPLGCRVNARATHRLIGAMLKAGYRKCQIARFLGLKRPILEVHPVTVTIETQARIQAAYDFAFAEAPE